MHPGGLIVAAFTCFVLLTAVETTYFGHNDLFNIFKLMSEVGQSYLDKQKDDTNANHVKEYTQQYLVVTVLSDLEIVQSKHWTNLQDIDNTNRLKIYINKKINDCNLQLGNKPIHGEIMCLYLNSRDGLKAMLEIFQENHDKELPNVVLYSYYIPCAYISGVQYSCSEELGKEALENQDIYRTLVGFKEIFPGTNETKAKEFLCRGNVGLFQLDQNTLTDLYLVNSPSVANNTMFQEQLLNCLTTIGVQKCCQNSVTNECQHTCFDEDFLILYIDDMCFNGVKTNNNMRGQLTELSREIFLKTAQTYIGLNVDPACGKCRYPDSVTDSIQFCVVDSLDKATYIGAKGLKSSKWERPPVNVPWGKLYPDTSPGCRFPRAQCDTSIVEKCQRKRVKGRFEERTKMRLSENAKARFKKYKLAKRVIPN